MNSYTFDFTLAGAATIEAESREEAERILKGVLDDAATFRAFQPGDEDDVIEGECSLIGEPTLATDLMEGGAQ